MNVSLRGMPKTIYFLFSILIQISVQKKRTTRKIKINKIVFLCFIRFCSFDWFGHWNLYLFFSHWICKAHTSDRSFLHSNEIYIEKTKQKNKISISDTVKCWLCANGHSFFFAFIIFCLLKFSIEFLVDWKANFVNYWID